MEYKIQEIYISKSNCSNHLNTIIRHLVQLPKNYIYKKATKKPEIFRFQAFSGAASQI